MIVEQRTYTLVAGGVPQYMEHYREEGLKIQEPILGNLVGWYFSEFGSLNQIVHMWGYDTYAERQRRRAELGENEDWKAFLSEIRPLIVKQENKILSPAPWSPK